LLFCSAAGAQPRDLQPIASAFVSPVSIANAGDGTKRLFRGRAGRNDPKRKRQSGACHAFDGGGAGDQPTNAQNMGIILGKIIRIKPSDDAACAGNLIAMSGARPEIWALDRAIPGRIAFDRQANDLLLADMGKSTEEEIDFQPDRAGGQNR
jgi:hypothetical protein